MLLIRLQFTEKARMISARGCHPGHPLRVQSQGLAHRIQRSHLLPSQSSPQYAASVCTSAVLSPVTAQVEHVNQPILRVAADQQGRHCATIDSTLCGYLNPCPKDKQTIHLFVLSLSAIFVRMTLCGVTPSKAVLHGTSCKRTSLEARE